MAATRVGLEGGVSAENLLRMDSDARFELDQGEMIPMSPPSAEHGDMALNLGSALRRFVRKHGLGAVYVETGFVLSRHPDVVRSPDVSFVRAQRLAGINREKFIEGAPDLAVEIASGSDRPAQLARKVQQYLAAGARLVWVVDPPGRLVHEYGRADKEGRVLRAGRPQGKLSAPELFPGWSMRVKELFS